MCMYKDMEREKEREREGKRERNVDYIPFNPPPVAHSAVRRAISIKPSLKFFELDGEEEEDEENLYSNRRLRRS